MVFVSFFGFFHYTISTLFRKEDFKKFLQNGTFSVILKENATEVSL